MPISSKKEYRSAVKNLTKLVEKGKLTEKETDQIETLKATISAYENRRFKIDSPDPVTSILFRMDQLGLTRRDLEAYLGSRGKVSEVLNKKRPLTLSMIKSLHSGLNIPADILIQDVGVEDQPVNEREWDWSLFPIAEMYKRGWISSKNLNRASTINELKAFFEPINISAPLSTHFRKSHFIRSARATDNYALLTWVCRLKQQVGTLEKNIPKYNKSLDLQDLRDIARISRYENGPVRVVDALRELGILLLLEPHLPKSYLDGASILDDQTRPVVGLTLRYDRINNFWFTLMHELAHVALHTGTGPTTFFDDLDHALNKDPREQEADAMATEALIPSSDWANSPARVLGTPEAIKHLANKLHVHPAVVAGHKQYVTKSYHILKNLVGYGTVRKQFPDINWS